MRFNFLYVFLINPIFVCFIRFIKKPILYKEIICAQDIIKIPKQLEKIWTFFPGRHFREILKNQVFKYSKIHNTKIIINFNTI
jgi:hypothetical protein